eukprot:TRINITY_DN32174_c0_g1_i2.p1 TRINITY_DN32174_c0_g1~~TRINITY_DN32174_c0_g1_i2.p1  ORF type:complete len:639 (-),score=111.95 TRINITY_DN32174_c0_g1_i2:261-2177(-)
MIPTSIAGKCSGLVRGLSAANRLAVPAVSRGMRIASARPVNNGTEVDIDFVDKTSYRFPTDLIKEASLGSSSSDFSRSRPLEGGKYRKYTAESVEPAADGSKLSVRFNMFSENAVLEQYSASFLHGLASRIGSPVTSSQSSGSSTTEVSQKPARFSPGTVMNRGALAHSSKKSLHRALGSVRGMKISSAKAVNDGKQVDIEFADKTAYRFHASWIKDAHPVNTGDDFYRKSAKTLFEVDQFTADIVKPAEDGEKLEVCFKNSDVNNAEKAQYLGSWLHAFAPYVGQPLHADVQASQSEGLKGTGSLLDHLYVNRKPWRSELKMPTFDGQAMLKDEDLQIEFLEAMMSTGAALITDIGKPEKIEQSSEGDGLCGKPMEDFVQKIIGRFNQHPARATRFGVIHTHARGEQAGADYDHKNPLSMHTDHSVYNGTPGYLQFMYQAQGSVHSKVVDGLAVAEYLKENHPEDYELLTTVNITHSSRNNIYARNGLYMRDTQDEAATFELVHTHPVLVLDKDGHLEKIVQSETKRGVSALPFDVYERYMEAYKRWTNLVEDPRFIAPFSWPEHSMIVMNNWRVLHGRATVPHGTQRTMVFAYVMKTIYENRHRYLKQRQAERRKPEMNAKWLTRLPNQVLSELVR